MKIYLFLYPIREYFESGVIGMSLEQFAKKGYSVTRLSDIIHTRYRAKGYDIWWLLFSESRDIPVVPDLRQLAPHVSVNEEDVFFSCGITFADQVKFQKYPDPDFIFRQMPRTMKHLVLGGFHQWDCVDKIATAAHERGFPVAVDEDTTDHFFYRTSLRGEIPLDRPLHNHVQELLEDCRQKMMPELVLAYREHKPWFAQLAPPATENS